MLIDAWTGRSWDYERRANRDEIAATGLAGPPGMAPEISLGDPQALADLVDHSERRSDSIVARDLESSLPAELDAEARLALVAEWTAWLANRYHTPVPYAIHRPSKDGDERNWHVHALMPARALAPGGATMGQKMRQWHMPTSASELRTVRAAWGEHVNRHLREAGIDATIDMSRTLFRRQRSTHLGPRRAGRLRRRERQRGIKPDGRGVLARAAEDLDRAGRTPTPDDDLVRLAVAPVAPGRPPTPRRKRTRRRTRPTSTPEPLATTRETRPERPRRRRRRRERPHLPPDTGHIRDALPAALGRPHERTPTTTQPAPPPDAPTPAQEPVRALRGHRHGRRRGATPPPDSGQARDAVRTAPARPRERTSAEARPTPPPEAPAMPRTGPERPRRRRRRRERPHLPPDTGHIRDALPAALGRPHERTPTTTQPAPPPDAPAGSKEPAQALRRRRRRRRDVAPPPDPGRRRRAEAALDQALADLEADAAVTTAADRSQVIAAPVTEGRRPDRDDDRLRWTVREQGAAVGERWLIEHAGYVVDPTDWHGVDETGEIARAIEPDVRPYAVPPMDDVGDSARPRHQDRLHHAIDRWRTHWAQAQGRIVAAVVWRIRASRDLPPSRASPIVAPALSSSTAPRAAPSPRPAPRSQNPGAARTRAGATSPHIS